MSEYALEAEEGATLGTTKEVADALIARFPESTREEPKLVAVKCNGYHLADVYIHNSLDEEPENIDEAPVTWFNILGDEEGDINYYLSNTYKVEELEM